MVIESQGFVLSKRLYYEYMVDLNHGLLIYLN